MFFEIGYYVHTGADHLLRLLLLGWKLGITWAVEYLDLAMFENRQKQSKIALTKNSSQ